MEYMAYSLHFEILNIEIFDCLIYQNQTVTIRPFLYDFYYKTHP